MKLLNRLLGRKAENKEGSKKAAEISVIIPMYNCEDFVQGVLQMFSEQSFDNFEVICVIDGATDSTEQKVREFCETDERFSFVVKENGGAGSARNTGLDHAKGTYVVWADADDIYANTFLAELYAAAKSTKADIAMCLAERKDSKLGTTKKNHGFKPQMFSPGKGTKPKDPKTLRSSIDVGIQYKMFRKKFVERNMLRFSCTRVSNDWFFDHAARIAAEKIVAVHKTLVTYRMHINESSITSKRELYIEDSVKVARELWDWLKDNNYLPQYTDYFISAFDGAMGYNIKFPRSERFIDAIVKTINEDEPWVNMNDEELLSSLKYSIGNEQRFTDMYEKLAREQKTAELAGYASALDTIRSVKRISAEKYGRFLK